MGKIAFHRKNFYSERTHTAQLQISCYQQNKSTEYKHWAFEKNDIVYYAPEDEDFMSILTWNIYVRMVFFLFFFSFIFFFTFLLSKQNVYNCPAANASELGDISALPHVRDDGIFSQLFVFFSNQEKEKQVFYYVYFSKTYWNCLFPPLTFCRIHKSFRIFGHAFVYNR